MTYIWHITPKRHLYSHAGTIGTLFKTRTSRSLLEPLLDESDRSSFDFEQPVPPYHTPPKPSYTMAWYNRFRRKAVVDKEGGTTPRAYKFFHPGQAFLLGFLLFGAFIIFLLVGICMPIIKAIYLFEIQAVPADGQPETSIGTQIRFGVWGLCITR